MSFKRTMDKTREDWPWTARQRRAKLGGRVSRKVDRHKVGKRVAKRQTRRGR
jgi:hypothetical protein